MNEEENELEMVLTDSTEPITEITHTIGIYDGKEQISILHIIEKDFGIMDTDWDFFDSPDPEILMKMGGLRESELLDRCIEVILHS